MKNLILIILFLFSLSIQEVWANNADKQFTGIMEAHWTEYLSQNPSFATSLGVRDFDKLLEDPSLKAYQAKLKSAKKFAKKLKAIDVKELSAANQLNHQLLTLDLNN